MLYQLRIDLRDVHSPEGRNRIRIGSETRREIDPINLSLDDDFSPFESPRFDRRILSETESWASANKREQNHEVFHH